MKWLVLISNIFCVDKVQKVDILHVPVGMTKKKFNESLQKGSVDADCFQDTCATNENGKRKWCLYLKHSPLERLCMDDKL